MSMDLFLNLDHFSQLFAFSSDGHAQLTCVGVALAISRLIMTGNVALVRLLAKIDERINEFTHEDPSALDYGEDSSDMKGIKDGYRKEMGVPPPKDVVAVMDFFSDLPGRVVNQDIHVGNIPWFGLGEKLEHDSQVRHFMRSRPEVKSDQAYLASVQYIRAHCTVAWKSLVKAISDMNNRSFFTDPVDSDCDQFLNELSKALHTVQDSYAPGHVHRNEHELIEEVYIWDDANKNEDKKTGWPGHSALDEPTHPMTAPHFRTAGFATRDAILCVLTTVNQQEPYFQAALNEMIASRFSGICVMK